MRQSNIIITQESAGQRRCEDRIQAGHFEMPTRHNRWILRRLPDKLCYFREKFDQVKLEKVSLASEDSREVCTKIIRGDI